MADNKRKKLLQVDNLRTYFKTENGIVKAVDGISFRTHEEETLAIVGESGSGKSITSLSVMQLISDNGYIDGGRVLFYNDELHEEVGSSYPVTKDEIDTHGNIVQVPDEKYGPGAVDILKMPQKIMRNIRGREISMIFQEPMTSLNPVFRVGYQIAEVIMLHERLSKDSANKKAVKMLELVGIPRAKDVANNYPFELSGGMRQRVMIAIALACDPKLLIADEPTTALDVTIQAQILKLMDDLKVATKTSIMLITHDLGVVAQMADYVIVMYCGKIVEDAPVDIIFKNPSHPYTIGLLESIPSAAKEGERLTSIPGSVPNPLELPQGCNFEPRCPYAIDKCKTEEPSLERTGKSHKVACWVKGGKSDDE